jgi:uncharacterized protein
MLIVAKILATLAAVAFALLLAAYFGQRRLMYFPDRTRTLPADVGLPSVREHIIDAPDGAKIVAWWATAKPGRPTLVYFHGNGGALAARQPRFERFMGEGWGVYMMAYRGYSGSTGSPTEADNVADALRAYDWITCQGVTSIILYGESLGTGVATQVAALRPSIGLILDAPYTSTWEVGALRYPFLPVHLAMWDRYETRRYIRNVRVPVLVIHGVLDPVIPVAMGREVARLAHEPKTLVEFPRGGHIDLYINGNEALPHVRAFVNGLGNNRRSGGKSQDDR